MKTLALVCTLLATWFTAGAIRADDDTGPYYVETDVGYTSLNRGTPTLAGGNSGGIDGNGTSEALIGGYVISDNFAAELGYHDYGSPGAFSQTGGLTQVCPQNFSCPHVNGLSAEFIGRYELVPLLDGELRVGVLDWHVGAPGS